MTIKNHGIRNTDDIPVGGQNLSFLPPAIILPYVGTTAPTGSFICDGSQISRTLYSALYAIIGNAYGSGDGSTTFHLPDLRGRVIRCVDNGAGHDPDSASRTASNTGGNTGDNIGSLQTDDTKQHSHTMQTSGSHTHGLRSEWGTNSNLNIGAPNGLYNQLSYQEGVGYMNTISVYASGDHTHTINNTGGNETRMKNIYCNYIITSGI